MLRRPSGDPVTVSYDFAHLGGMDRLVEIADALSARNCSFRPPSWNYPQGIAFVHNMNPQNSGDGDIRDSDTLSTPEQNRKRKINFPSLPGEPFFSKHNRFAKQLQGLLEYVVDDLLSQTEALPDGRVSHTSRIARDFETLLRISDRQISAREERQLFQKAGPADGGGITFDIKIASKKVGIPMSPKKNGGSGPASEEATPITLLVDYMKLPGNSVEELASRLAYTILKEELLEEAQNNKLYY